MSDVEIYPGDNRESLRRLIDQGVRVHSVVTDPPYSLTSIVKRFGKDGAAPAKFGRDGAFQRASAGFMGLAWDATGIEYDPEFWALIYEILLPGGFVFAFSSPRTGHRQACAMEMVGFIMHPFHGWLYGSGMPKAHNIRDVPEWEGWAYGTQTQKPAMEPIYLAQKPYSEKTGIANLTKHGVGAFNIDGCRVAVDTVVDASQLRTMTRGQRTEADNGHAWGMNTQTTTQGTVVSANGRWPANILHDGSDEVVALFPESVGQQGDVRGDEPSLPTKDIYGQFKGRVASVARKDSGSAARFFNSFPNDQIPIAIYHGKATKADRAGGKHPTVKPIGLLRHLVRHITPPGGLVLDPFAGSGTTGAAALAEGMNCILMEAEVEYVEFLHQRFGTSPPIPLTNWDYLLS